MVQSKKSVKKTRVKNTSAKTAAKKSAKKVSAKKASAKKAIKRAAAPKAIKVIAKKEPVMSIAKAEAVSTGPVAFSEGLEYPWGKAKRLWNILWALVPIVGILALIGYESKIVQAIVGGNKKGLPAFGSFKSNMKIGFFLVLKSLPLFGILWLIGQIGLVGKIINIIAYVFIVPYLVINLLHTNRIDAVFEIPKAIRAVFGNLGDYIRVVLRTILFVVIYGVLSMILIGIPCLEFGEYVYIADFYGRRQ